MSEYELEHYILKKGKIVRTDLWGWAEDMQAGNHVLWRKWGDGKQLVSTVFLGIDHMGMWFESMHFPSNDQIRCKTYEEAKGMHARMCRSHRRRSYYQRRCWAAGIPTHKRIRVMKKRLKA